MLGGICPTATFGIPIDVSVYSSLCCTSTCAFMADLDYLLTRACIAPVRVSLQEVFASPGRVCMSTRACAEPVHVLFCATWTYLSTRACATPVWSVYKAILLHLDVSARLNEQGSVLHLYGSVRVLFCAAPGHVCLQVPVLYLSLYGMSTRALCCTWTFLSSPWYTWICKVNTQAFRFGSEKQQIELHLRKRQWSRKPIINVPYWPKGGLPAPTAVRKLMILFSDTPSSTAHGYLMVSLKAL